MRVKSKGSKVSVRESLGWMGELKISDLLCQGILLPHLRSRLHNNAYAFIMKSFA